MGASYKVGAGAQHKFFPGPLTYKLLPMLLTADVIVSRMLYQDECISEACSGSDEAALIDVGTYSGLSFISIVISHLQRLVGRHNPNFFRPP